MQTNRILLLKYICVCNKTYKDEKSFVKVPRAKITSKCRSPIFTNILLPRHPCPPETSKKTNTLICHAIGFVVVAPLYIIWLWYRAGRNPNLIELKTRLGNVHHAERTNRELFILHGFSEDGQILIKLQL